MTASVLNTSAVPFPDLQRKQYTLRNRAKKYHVASRNNQETKTAVSSDSKDPDNSQPILNIEEKGVNREFFSESLITERLAKFKSIGRREPSSRTEPT